MNRKHRKLRSTAKIDLDEILPEYDFSYAQPNKYAARFTSPGRASESKATLQDNDLLDVEAIFTLGFNGEEARRTFIAEMGNLTGLQ
jgi:hypothetical protein